MASEDRIDELFSGCDGYGEGIPFLVFLCTEDWVKDMFPEYGEGIPFLAFLCNEGWVKEMFPDLDLPADASRRRRLHRQPESPSHAAAVECAARPSFQIPDLNLPADAGASPRRLRRQPECPSRAEAADADVAGKRISSHGDGGGGCKKRKVITSSSSSSSSSCSSAPPHQPNILRR